MTLEGTGINPTPVDLHEQQLSLEQHNQAHRITTMDTQFSMSPPPILVCPCVVPSEQYLSKIIHVGFICSFF